MKNLYVDSYNGYWSKVPLKVKFFSLAFFTLGILFSANLALLVLNLVIVLSFGLIGGGGVILLARLKPFIYFALFIIIFHSILNPANQNMFYYFGLEGTTYGTIVSLRLIGIVLLAQVALITTAPRNIFLLFSSFHPDLGMIMLLLIGFIPVLEEEMVNTSQAQQTRGLVWNNLPDKIRAYLAMIIPVIIKALYRAQGMASLLHLRGYEHHDCETARCALKPLLAKGFRLLALVALLFFLINLAFFVGLRLKGWGI
jgi:energy-coupling factor transport system permease protein